MSNNEIHDKDELRPEDLAPKLYKLDKSNPFKVPESYFEHFENRMMNAINQAENSVVKKQKSGFFTFIGGLFNTIPTKIALTISGIALVLLGTFVLIGLGNSAQTINDKELQAKLREHKTIDLRNYVRDEIENIDESLITEVVLNSADFLNNESDVWNEIVNEMDESTLEKELL